MLFSDESTSACDAIGFNMQMCFCISSRLCCVLKNHIIIIKKKSSHYTVLAVYLVVAICLNSIFSIECKHSKKKEREKEVTAATRKEKITHKQHTLRENNSVSVIESFLLLFD